MTNLISPEELLADLRVVAEKKKAELGHDYTYRRINGEPYGSTTGQCYYEHNGKPSCIFGHLLADHYDVPLYKLREEAEGHSISSVMADFGLAKYRCNPAGTTRSESSSIAQRIADDVQQLQDAGTPWLAAVETIEAKYQRGAYI